MHTEAPPRPAVCPACTILPHEQPHAADSAAPGDIVLSLPTIHCAVCISAVERQLARMQGVTSARVNLSLRRVLVTARTGTTAGDLIASLATIGYEAHELDADLLSQAPDDAKGRNLLMRLAVSGFAMMNVLLLSVAVWAGAEAATRDMMHWISAAIALPAIAFAAQPFFASGWSVLRVGRLNMDVPISLAILLATAMSLVETALGGAHTYFDAALSLTFFLLAGRYLDHRTRSSARSAASELAALEIPRAHRLVDGVEELVPTADLRAGDVIAVKPGMRIPVDGRILCGESEIDRAFLTGESLPVHAGPGTTVHAGEINLTGPLTAEVTARTADSALQRLSRLVALAETARNRYTSLADRAAAVYAPGVHLLALAAFAGWMWATGDLRLSLNTAIAVLIITCPCALGLAVPAVSTAASGRLFRKGVLLKSATALERLAEIDTVVFDKTGTLTMGEPQLEHPESIGDAELALAASLAHASLHPFSRAILRAAKARKLAPPDNVRNLHEVAGCGVEAELGADIVRLGRAGWVGEADGDGRETWLKIGTDPARRLTFTETIRPGIVALIARLDAANIDVRLMTGDARWAAEDVARKTGIKNLIASADPAEKSARIAELSRAAHKVLMVGDGLNDTAALSIAHVSLSPASAIDAARVASDIVILGDDFSPLFACLTTARSARARIRENFALAALYNAVAVPVAVLGFATPLLAALAMSASSITVTLNSWRVR